MKKQQLIAAEYFQAVSVWKRLMPSSRRIVVKCFTKMNVEIFSLFCESSETEKEHVFGNNSPNDDKPTFQGRYILWK